METADQNDQKDAAATGVVEQATTKGDKTDEYTNQVGTNKDKRNKNRGGKDQKRMGHRFGGGFAPSADSKRFEEDPMFRRKMMMQKRNKKFSRGGRPTTTTASNQQQAA